jgi:hypothetical protein
LIGRPENVVAALKAESAKLTGQCKAEFDDALPHLSGLVLENFHQEHDRVPMVSLEACGSGTSTTHPETKETRQLERSCTVKLERFYRKVLSEAAD